jgi:protein-S-isoprenylcysteine O-methyltransferase Ste14
MTEYDKVNAKQPKMSNWGVGPWFVALSYLFAAMLAFFAYRYDFMLKVNSARVIMYLVGILFFLSGAAFWIRSGISIDGYINQGVMPDKGIYGLVRHPLYTGAFMVLAGVLIFSRSITLLCYFFSRLYFCFL